MKSQTKRNLSSTFIAMSFQETNEAVLAVTALYSYVAFWSFMYAYFVVVNRLNVYMFYLSEEIANRQIFSLLIRFEHIALRLLPGFLNFV